MKRIAEWFAAVGAAAGRKGKRLVAIVAAVAMLGGVAGVSATAMADDGNASTTQSQTTDEKAAASAPAPLSTEGTNGVPDDPTLSAPAREKTVTANEDGTYTVAFVPLRPGRYKLTLRLLYQPTMYRIFGSNITRHRIRHRRR